jgi:isopenicillin N synthase-like dioxygenase
MTPVADARIPTIDFAAYRHGTAAERAALVAALGNAAEVYGFVLIVGHGIAPEVLRGGFDAGRSFFELPESVKRTMQETGSDRGYQPMFDNLRDDGKPSGQEGYTMGHPVMPADPELAAEPFHAPTPWPPVANFRERFEALYDAMFELGRDLLGAMAVHLGADAKFFEHALVDTYSHMRINHYPPHEAIAHVADEGVFAHHDESLITLLLQDGNSGLQVMGRDGAWIDVQPNPAAVVVNVGKMLRHWTGGRYNAALHQVINVSGRDRYSIPLFMHPALRTVVDPRDLVGGVAPDPAFPPIVAGATVQASFAATRASWKEMAAEGAEG